VEIPVVDIGGWWSTSAERTAVGRQVDAAAREFGFFQIVGHRLPSAALRSGTLAAFRRRAA